MTTSDPSAESNPPVPYRQIRALYDDETITVYQAYSAAIAIPAVKEQKLSASPAFKPSRMTWIKPSWCWMMYRSGYSHKDKNQEHILALKMKREDFHQLLAAASVSCGGHLTTEEKSRQVRVQWDPERSPALDVLPYRSIQIRISSVMSKTWVDGWIVSIEDVTAAAKALKRALEEEPKWTLEDLAARGLVPREEVYEISNELRKILKMDREDKE
ncbi:ATP-dependent RNA helicase DHX8 [Lyophyllum atratum]|nr:ATP-dependent RNA helicase DHX8 [Lyophyllum atratum]